MHIATKLKRESASVDLELVWFWIGTKGLV